MQPYRHRFHIHGSAETCIHKCIPIQPCLSQLLYISRVPDQNGVSLCLRCTILVGNPRYRILIQMNNFLQTPMIERKDKQQAQTHSFVLKTPHIHPHTELCLEVSRQICQRNIYLASKITIYNVVTECSQSKQFSFTPPPPPLPTGNI